MNLEMFLDDYFWNNIPRPRASLGGLRKKYTGRRYKYDIKLRTYLKSSFDDFVKRNKITLIDEGLYEYYFRENFVDYLGIRPYGLYQHHFYEKIDKHCSSHDLIDKILKLSKNVSLSNIQYTTLKKITEFSFDVKSKNKLFIEKIRYLLRQYNYYIKEKTLDDKSNSYHIVISPYDPRKVTRYIYNFDNIYQTLYCIVPKDKYLNKIKNKELICKQTWKEYKNERIFFIGNKDETEVQKQLIYIKNSSKQLNNKDTVVLKINLWDYVIMWRHYKLRFRLDSSSNEYDAYFTEEPIPHFCITPMDLETWKELKI